MKRSTLAAAFLSFLFLLQHTSPSARAQEEDPCDPPGAPRIVAPGEGTLVCNRVSVCSRDASQLINGEAAVAEGLFWQTDFLDRRLRLFDRTDDLCRVVMAIDVPPGAPSENAYDGEFVYHYNFDTGLIYVYDATTGELVNQCDAPGDDQAEGLTFDGEMLWKGDGERLRRFQILQNGQCVVDRIFNNPPGEAADGLAFCGDFLLMLAYSGLLYQIDPNNGRVLGICRLNDGPQSNGLAADGNLRVAADQPTSIDLIELDCGEVFGGPRYGSVTPCGEEFMLTAGIPFSYQVRITEPTDDEVRLDAIEKPDGSSHSRPLPFRDTPEFSTFFQWTPNNGDVGEHRVFYTARAGNLVSICRVTLVVAECHLLMGRSRGAEPYEVGGYTFSTQLAESHPVLIEDIPAFPLPRPKPGGLGGKPRHGQGTSPVTLVDRFYAQVVMYNPEVFPENVEQSTPGLDVRVWSDGTATAHPYGTSDGMRIALEVFTGKDGKRYFRLPFLIDGMPE